MKLSNSIRFALPALVFTLAAAITLDTNLPQATFGQPYNASLNATGGSSPYSYAINSGGLPAGLTLSGGGTITGTPQNAGQFNFSVLTTDSLAATAVTNFSLRVPSPSGLTITNTALATGRINTAYTMTLTAQGGASPYSWDIVMGSGTLPAGITISSQGRLEGTPTSGGVFPLTVRVTDASGNSFQAALPLRIEATALAIATTSLAGASTNVPYSQGFAAIGGTPPYAYSLLSGTLPTGLALSAGGVLSGTPTAAGTFVFVVRTTDSTSATAQASFTIVVSGSGPRIVISSLPNGILNQIFNATLTAQGGTPPYTFSVISGNLPSGLSLNLNGTITGTPTVSGVFPLTVRLGDAAAQSSQADLILNINSGAFSINSAIPPDGVVNTPYTFALSSTGGTAPNAYALLSGTLPAGLILNSNGTFTGTPTLAGSYPVVVRATDAGGATAQAALTIRILSSTLSLSQSGAANAQLGQTYSSTLTAAGGAAPYSFNLVTGTLPPGLTLASNGNISGTPTTAGLYLFTYRVLDSNQRSAEATLSIFVGGGSIGITTLTLPSGRPNQAYNTTLAASGGTAPYTFQLVTGTLPTGLTLSPGGVLSGTLTQPTNGAFTVRITDAAAASILVSYLFNSNTAAVGISSIIPATGVHGQLYTTTITTTGNTGANTFNIDSGSLPPGLTLSSGGTLSGTPTAAGVYVFNIRITDASLASANFSQAITITSSAQLGFATTTLPAITAGTAYSASFTGVNGTSPYTFALIDGTLPSGMSLAANGGLSGTATTAGSFPISVRITDAAGATATASITLAVNASAVFAITTNTLPTGKRNELYSVMIVASGGQAPYTFQLATGSTLPAGLTLSAAGLISGTPTTDGLTTFTIQATDASSAVTQRSFTLTVSSTSLSISSVQFSNGIVGDPYTSNLTASGGTPGYTFSLLSGTLPPGLSFASTGVLSGTPTAIGTFPVVIRVTDAASVTSQKAFNILVGSSRLAFTNVSLPMAFLMQPYRTNLQAAAGTQPYTFSIESGTLPAGLTLNPSGLISGTATAAGQSTVTFKVTDAAGATALNTLILGVTQSTVSFGFTSIPNATVGQPFNFAPTGSGDGIYAFYILGGLPPGIFIDRFGNLVGVPTRAGNYSVTIQARNSSGASVVASFPLTVMSAATSLPVQ